MNSTLCNLYQLSHKLRLPASWLKDEADAHRIPCLRAGRRRLFNLEAVEQALVVRAGGEVHAGRAEAEVAR